MKQLRFGCWMIALASFPAVQAQGSTPLTLDDFDRLAKLSSPALSPDGSRIAVVVSRVDVAANARRAELDLVPTAGGEPVVVAKRDVAAPSWSPDGHWLAWIGRDEAGDTRLHVAEASAPDRATVIGGASGRGVRRFAWSKDGRAIAYLADKPAGKRDVDKAFEIPDADYLGTSYIARDGGGPPAEIWIAAPDAATPRRLTGIPGFPQDLVWSADGRAVLIQTQPGASVAAAAQASLVSVSVESGEVATLIAAPAPLGTGARLAVAHDGAIAFQYFRGPDPWTQANSIGAYRNGRVTVISQALDRQIDDFQWIPGTSDMIAQAADHNRVGMWRITDRGKVIPLPLGNLDPIGPADVGGKGAIAFVGSAARQAPELYFKASATADPVRLTRFGQALEPRHLGKVETIAWSSGGFSHDGVLTYPPDFDPSQRYPLLVDIHGGPELSATDAFDFSSHYYAAHGWIVFRPNYRGSSGRSNDYQAAIADDLLRGSGEDIVAGVDKVAAALPIDRKRIALTGWSWGGVLTSWLIGQDQRWCAAVPGAMAVDFTSYYDLSETAIWMHTMLGSPYVGDNLKRYRSVSPLTYLGNATTPTLILHNVGDPNAPVTQSITLYHALKDRGVKTRMVLRDIDGHLYGDPFGEKQVYALTLGWISENCPAGGSPRSTLTAPLARTAPAFANHSADLP